MIFQVLTLHVLPGALGSYVLVQNEEDALEEAHYTDNRLIAPVEVGGFYALHAVAREHEERDIEESEKRLKTDQAPDLDEQIQRICRLVARNNRQSETRRAVPASEEASRRKTHAY